MYRCTALVCAFLLVYLCELTPADGELQAPERPIKLSFEAVKKTVKRGAVPKFKLTIHNEGKSREQVPDISRRPDLQDTYYDLEVTQGGKAVQVARAISDPGPLGDEDFRVLKMGEKVTFELSRFALSLEKLPPGKYQARIRFWQYPKTRAAKDAFFSPFAEFTVQK